MSSAAASTPFWKLQIGKKKAEVVEVEHPPFTATLPHVDLTPESIRDAVAVRKIRRGFIFAGVALVALGMLAWLMQNGSILEAQTRLTSEQNTNAAVAAQVKALAPIEQLYQQITTQEAFISDAVASEAISSQVLAQMSALAGKDIDYTGMTVTYTGIPKPKLSATPATALNTCPNADPFGKDITVGCMTFSATTTSRARISEFLNAAQANPYLVGPYVTATTVSQSATGASLLSFSGSAGISLKALRKALTNDRITAIREEAASAAGTAAVDPTAK